MHKMHRKKGTIHWIHNVGKIQMKNIKTPSFRCLGGRGGRWLYIKGTLHKRISLFVMMSLWSQLYNVFCGVFQSLKKDIRGYFGLRFKVHICHIKYYEVDVWSLKDVGIWQKKMIKWNMLLSCIMGYVGSFAAWPMLGNNIQISNYDHFLKICLLWVF